MPDDTGEAGAEGLAEIDARIAGLEKALDGLRGLPGGLASREAERFRSEILELERRRVDLPPSDPPDLITGTARHPAQPAERARITASG